MKKITTVVALLGTLTLGLAADATIDAQIEKIQNAPAAEKVQLMNEFKQELMTMKQEQRQEAVAKLQAKMQATGEMTKTQAQERKQARVDQAEATGEMVRTQQMNQKQAGKQMMEGIMNGTIPNNTNQNGGNAGAQPSVTLP
ncbi:MAG: hypothetical protein U9Q40_06320 [Campylobacterota bacterium]|nr:hypothetical protein [Campylobacterota bacterium]